MATPSHARKTATNVSLRSDPVKEAEGSAWLEQNRDAIGSYNALVAKHVFSDGRRRF